MISRKCVSAIAITAFMLLSSAMIFMSQRADAASWLTTTDTDFSSGYFYTGTGFESELHGTGAAAYIQNKMGMMNWIQKYPGTDTGPRTQFGFTNDSQESRFILFGGLAGSVWRNDTWEYNYAAQNWERICSDNTPACAPPKRLAPSMAYDNNSKVAVMYGGLDDQGLLLSDTWEYDISTNKWTNWTKPMAPRGMSAHKLVYDAKDKRVILVGRGVAAMEVWEYDAATHTWANMNAIGGPSQRGGYALGYSYQANHQRVVLFGGAEVMTFFDETWEYNYASRSWSQVSPADKPTARTGSSMTYNFKQSIEGLILWGGNSWSTETWRYNWTGTTPTWNQLQTTTTPNPGRMNHGLAYDPGYNALMIYGGEPFTGPKLNDTWMLETGFNLEGRYYSRFFNTFVTATEWKYIFFNKTSEPNTEVRFQVEANNVCDNGALPNFKGPGGLPNTYYNTTGEALWSLLAGNKCLRWMADMITFNPSVAPQLQDVTIIYDAGIIKPQVSSVSPTGAGNPINSHIYINFTKPVDTLNTWVFVWRIDDLANVTLDQPYSWSEANSKVEIKHDGQPFSEAHGYRARVYAADTLGQSLNYSLGYYQWAFTTAGIPPEITVTQPGANDVDVGLSAPVIITFSEPMNTATCWPYVTINPVIPATLAFDGHSWSGGDRVLTLTHTVPYQQFTTYTIDVPIGDPTRPCQDKSDVLLTFGSTALPWSFTTLALNPFITLTVPVDLQPEIPTNTDVKATFSKDMDHSNFYYTFKEWDQTTGAWKNWTGTFNAPTWSGRSVTLSHTTAFTNCKPYRVEMWALNLTGKPLITNPAVPNPWKFMTIGASGACGPFLIHATPSDGEQDVPILKNVTLFFYYSPPDTGGMNPSSFDFSFKDKWNTELKSHFTQNWIGMGPNAVELVHPDYPLDPCQEYTVKVLTARDNSGRALIPGLAVNPFKFKTVTTDCRPAMIWAQPANGTLDAPLDQSIVLKFSEEMNPASLIVDIRPLITLNTPVWTESNSNVSITHSSFALCEWYNISVFAKNPADLNIGRGPVPNPFMFRAFCPPSGTYITETYPANGQTGIPLMASIWVNFSDPMDTSSLTFSLLPGSITTTQYWYNLDKTVRLDHTTPYTQGTLYTANVVTARNKTGGNIVAGGVPNPWTFRALAQAPYIVTTIPPDRQRDVLLDATIKVIFNKPMDQTSVTFATIPSPALGYTQQWIDGQTVVFSHTTPFAFCTNYTARVLDARDTIGTHLGPGPIPNPWNFTTSCQFQVKGLKVTRQGPNVRLDWTADAQVQFWNVFHSNDRLTPWNSWTMIQNITTPSNNFYIHTNAIGDMQNHFYIVRGFKLGGWSSNSTMGALWHPQLAPNAGRPSAFWFSLPYNSWYKKAKAISDELTYQKINVVAKFDASKQKTVIWYYSHGTWRGTNFDINAGEGLMIGVVSNFDWAINGTDKIIPIVFTYRVQLRTNIYWIGLPYANGLASASELVTAIAGGIGPGTNSKIIAVGKWVYSTQSSRVYSYTIAGWSGDNFNIGSGDGIWIEIASSFSWSPTLITPEVP